MTLAEALDKLGCGIPCQRNAPVNLDVVNILCEVIAEVQRNDQRIARLEKAADPHTLRATDL